jgi:hypothetical protein
MLESMKWINPGTKLLSGDHGAEFTAETLVFGTIIAVVPGLPAGKK